MRLLDPQQPAACLNFPQKQEFGQFLIHETTGRRLKSVTGFRCNSFNGAISGAVPFAETVFAIGDLLDRPVKMATELLRINPKVPTALIIPHKEMLTQRVLATVGFKAGRDIPVERHHKRPARRQAKPRVQYF